LELEKAGVDIQSVTLVLHFWTTNMGAKDQKSYWKDRVRKRTGHRGGKIVESSEYYAFLQWGGKRKWIPLGTGNADKAAVAAAKKYIALTEGGWAALDKKSNATADSLTVGKFLEQLENVTKVSPRTWGNYVKAFRQIVSEIKGLKAPKGDKFQWEDYRTWRAKFDELTLAVLTEESITTWTRQYVSKRDKGPEAARKARNSCNTHLRNAKALFNEDLLRVAGFNDLENPFRRVKGYSPERRRYRSSFDAQALLLAAQKELAGPQAEGESKDLSFRRQEAFKALVLFGFTAIRRKEADLLLWDQVNLGEGHIDIRRTRYFEPKADSSVGRIPIDGDAVDLLRQFRETDKKGEFVLRGPKPRKNSTHSAYRCEKTFRHLIKWLKTYENESGQRPFRDIQKPLHEIRKEIGAILATKHGIFVAQRFLRHAEISTTERFYSDQKERLTAGLKLNDDEKKA
jgi:hypothetical protein